MGENEEQIEDQAELAQVRRQASKVRVKSMAAALALTLIALLIPAVTQNGSILCRQFHQTQAVLAASEIRGVRMNHNPLGF